MTFKEGQIVETSAGLAEVIASDNQTALVKMTESTDYSGKILEYNLEDLKEAVSKKRVVIEAKWYGKTDKKFHTDVLYFDDSPSDKEIVAKINKSYSKIQVDFLHKFRHLESVSKEGFDTLARKMFNKNPADLTEEESDEVDYELSKEAVSKEAVSKESVSKNIDSKTKRTKAEWEKIFKEWSVEMDKLYTNKKQRTDAGEWNDNPVHWMKPSSTAIYNAWEDYDNGGSPYTNKIYSKLPIKEAASKKKLSFFDIRQKWDGDASSGSPYAIARKKGDSHEDAVRKAVASESVSKESLWTVKIDGKVKANIEASSKIAAEKDWNILRKNVKDGDKGYTIELAKESVSKKAKTFNFGGVDYKVTKVTKLGYNVIDTSTNKPAFFSKKDINELKNLGF